MRSAAMGLRRYITIKHAFIFLAVELVYVAALIVGKLSAVAQ
ncbi:MAG: hypothetical protein AAGL49_09000 [Pseudomonadota bacterium]